MYIDNLPNELFCKSTEILDQAGLIYNFQKFTIGFRYLNVWYL